MKDTALQPTPAQLGEETLNGVEPGARGWREVEDETRMAIEPGANVRMLVGGIVVKNDTMILPTGISASIVFRNRMSS